MKTIFRSVLTSDFTILPNATLRDKRLSFKARGILAMALSNKDDWEVRPSNLASGKEGSSAVNSGLLELRKLGYCKMEKLKDESGHFYCLWSFYDSPLCDDPECYNPSSDNPRSENRPYKEELTKEENHKEEGEAAPNKAKTKSALVEHLKLRWNAVCAPAGMPLVLGTAGKRFTQAAARMSEPRFVADFEQAMKKICKSKFCNGKNERGWFANFDFFIRPGTLDKIMEGNYDEKVKAKAVGGNF